MAKRSLLSRCPSYLFIHPFISYLQWVPGLVPGHKAAGSWRLPPTPHLRPWLKKEYSYATTPRMSLHGLF